MAAAGLEAVDCDPLGVLSRLFRAGVALALRMRTIAAGRCLALGEGEQSRVEL